MLKLGKQRIKSSVYFQIKKRSYFVLWIVIWFRSVSHSFDLAKTLVLSGIKSNSEICQISLLQITLLKTHFCHLETSCGICSSLSSLDWVCLSSQTVTLSNASAILDIIVSSSDTGFSCVSLQHSLLCQLETWPQYGRPGYYTLNRMSGQKWG